MWRLGHLYFLHWRRLLLRLLYYIGMNIYEMFLVRAKKYALAEISSGKGMTASFLLRFHILQKFRADLLDPLADAAVIGESEPLGDFRLRVPGKQEPDDISDFSRPDAW